MFDKPSDESEQLDKTIAQLESDMENVSGDSDEYPKMVNHLERLYKLKTANARKTVDPNTVIIVLGNLAGIFAILHYERAAVVVSRAITFAGKLK